MKGNVGQNIDGCIPTYVSTCEKDIYHVGKIKSKTEGNQLERPIEHYSLNENTFAIREINLEDILIQQTEKQLITSINSELISGTLKPSDYLNLIKSHMPEELISTQCFEEIKNLSYYFRDSLTSFIIFESRLGSYDGRSDYCFAISSKNEERDILANFVKNNDLPEAFLKRPEWKQIGNFVEKWTDPKSILYDSVIGFWFEFDTANHLPETPIPSVFIQPASHYAISGDVSSQYTWITKIALPLLIGRPLPSNVEKKVIKCIKMLPLDASLFQIGTMLSRNNDEIRLVIKGIKLCQIISYLKSIGWSDNKDEGLYSLLGEIQDKITRVVLHISIGKQINPNIGIECSFSPNKYHQENGWSKFLNYLKEKGLCTQEKLLALFNFQGIDPGYYNKDFNPKNCTPSVMIHGEKFPSVLIRYISHIKLVYQPDKTLEAKAYTAVRLFGYPTQSANQMTRLIVNK